MPFLVQIVHSPRFFICVLGGFLIAVVASPSFPFVNGPLAMLLIIGVTLCLLSVSMGYCDDVSKEIRRKQQRSRYKKAEYLLIFAPSFSLSILLLIRLFSRDHFYTIPGLLEFGPKKGDGFDYEPNLAFIGGGFGAFGHLIQGFLASFLLRVKCKCKKNDDDDDDANDSLDGNENDDDPKMTWRFGSTPPDMNLFNITAYFFLVYPIYNFVKRYVRTPDTFATSSYMGNGMEWTVGFWVGHTAGFIADAGSYKKMHGNTSTTSSDSSSTGDTVMATSISVISQDETTITSAIGTTTIAIDDATESRSGVQNKWTCPCSVSFVLLMFGWLVGFWFLVSVFGACIMTGYTWNMCEGESEDCLNFSESGGRISISVILSMIPALGVCGVLL